MTAHPFTVDTCFVKLDAWIRASPEQRFYELTFNAAAGVYELCIYLAHNETHPDDGANDRARNDRVEWKGTLLRPLLNHVVSVELARVTPVFAEGEAVTVPYAKSETRAAGRIVSEIEASDGDGLRSYWVAVTPPDGSAERNLMYLAGEIERAAVEGDTPAG